MTTETFMAQFEKGLQESFGGTRYEGQIPTMLRFEREGCERSPEVGSKWCECGGLTGPPASEVAYFRRPESGSHGWFHVKCKGITQTG